MRALFIRSHQPRIADNIGAQHDGRSISRLAALTGRISAESAPKLLSRHRPLRGRWTGFHRERISSAESRSGWGLSSYGGAGKKCRCNFVIFASCPSNIQLKGHHRHLGKRRHRVSDRSDGGEVGHFRSCQSRGPELISHRLLRTPQAFDRNDGRDPSLFYEMVAAMLANIQISGLPRVEMGIDQSSRSCHFDLPLPTPGL